MGFLDERCLFQELTDEKIAVSKPFYCGNNDLDEFFHEDVTKFSYNLMGKSYCFVLEKDPSQAYAQILRSTCRTVGG